VILKTFLRLANASSKLKTRLNFIGPFCVRRWYGVTFSSLLGILLSAFLATHSFAQNKSNALDPQSSSVKIQDQVIPLGTDYQNSIKLLNNRFRVDSDVSEVTLIFFRQYGTAPIVLVRPDGSKLYLENDSGDDSFNWFETDTYDMISLINPMPGPWQAVGDILPESRVMVIADVTLQAQQIPNIVFSGETLKQTAFLKNAGTRVDMSSFRDVVSLSIDFVSTNNPNYPNFGLGSRSVARFEDNGLGFDEVDGDGTFTGQFNLQITEGEWQPIFTVRTPLFSREQVNDKVILLPSPIKLSHSIAYNEQKDHLLTIDADREYVDISSLLVDGTVRQPNGEVVRFSITEISDSAKTVDILNTAFGIYKINMTVFALSNDGRDLVIDVPEYSFVYEPPPVVIEPIEVATEEVAPEPIVLDLPEEESSPVLLVIVINLSILILGGLALFLIFDKRNNPSNWIVHRVMAKIKQTFAQIKLKLKKTDKNKVGEADAAELKKADA